MNCEQPLKSDYSFRIPKGINASLEVVFDMTKEKFVPSTYCDIKGVVLNNGFQAYEENGSGRITTQIDALPIKVLMVQDWHLRAHRFHFIADAYRLFTHLSERS